MSETKVLILDNLLDDLIKNRMQLGDYLASRNCSVFYGCPNNINYPGINDIQIYRNRINIFQFMRAIKNVLNIENKKSINAVISFRLVPNILNAGCSFFHPKVRRVLVVTGLGLTFVDGNGKIFTRYVIRKFYQWASKRFRIVVQNVEDSLELNLESFKVIYGSGISGEPVCTINKSQELRLIFAGRLLKSKGVMDCLEVLRLLRLRNVKAFLTIAGGFDRENPDSISEGEYSKLKSTEGVVLLGHVNNLDEIYKQSDVLIFLSTYREGVPRVMIESLRHGLTICTLNMPGCKDGVVENGLIINSIDEIGQLVDYLARLNHFDLTANMKKSHILFEKKFSSKVIFKEYFDAIN